MVAGSEDPGYVTDEAALLHEIRDCLAEVRDALREFLPYARAYLDPDQSGPRGWAIRRQLAKNGKGMP